MHKIAYRAIFAACLLGGVVAIGGIGFNWLNRVGDTEEHAPPQKRAKSQDDSVTRNETRIQVLVKEIQEELLREEQRQERVPQNGSFAADSDATNAPFRPMTVRMLERLNEERIRRHLAPVSEHRLLGTVALRHTLDQARQGEISHTGSDGSTVASRIYDTEVNPRLMWRQIGEIVAMNWNMDDPVETAIQSWIDSPGHNEQMFTAVYNYAGGGVARGAKGDYYFTIVFMCLPEQNVPEKR